jgi:hypothetical protein
MIDCIISACIGGVIGGAIAIIVVFLRHPFLLKRQRRRIRGVREPDNVRWLS